MGKVKMVVSRVVTSNKYLRIYINGVFCSLIALDSIRRSSVGVPTSFFILRERLFQCRDSILLNLQKGDKISIRAGKRGENPSQLDENHIILESGFVYTEQIEINSIMLLSPSDMGATEIIVESVVDWLSDKKIQELITFLSNWENEHG